MFDAETCSCEKVKTNLSFRTTPGPPDRCHGLARRNNDADAKQGWPEKVGFMTFVFRMLAGTGICLRLLEIRKVIDEKVGIWSLKLGLLMSMLMMAFLMLCSSATPCVGGGLVGET
jgi:hypothetical protein